MGDLVHERRIVTLRKTDGQEARLHLGAHGLKRALELNKSRLDRVLLVAGVLPVSEKDDRDLLDLLVVIDVSLQPVEDLLEVRGTTCTQTLDVGLIFLQVGVDFRLDIVVVQHGDEGLEGSIVAQQGLPEFKRSKLDRLKRSASHGSAPIKAGDEYLALVVDDLAILGFSHILVLGFTHGDLVLHEGVGVVNGEVLALHVLVVTAWLDHNGNAIY